MIGVQTTKDIYKRYAKKLITENPGYWGKYQKRTKNYFVYKLDHKGIPTLVTSYPLFKSIVSTWFKGATQFIIDGYSLQLGNGLGQIAGRRVERNHKNKQVNWEASEAKWSKTGVRKDPVYYIDEDWVRVGWTKTNKVRNCYLYRFSPAEGNKSGKGFKKEFSLANKQDDRLKFKYKFYPFINIEE